MANKTVSCRDCKKEFEINPNARYKRKYCDKCSAERKKAYDNIHLVKFEDSEDE
mgnify:CR=1 FL=1